MKRFKINNAVARLQDYLGDPIDLYFLVLKKLDEDVYKFNRIIGCHSYRDSDGIHRGMIYRGNTNIPLHAYAYKYGYNYRKSLKTKKRMYKKTLRSQVIRRCYEY